MALRIGQMNAASQPAVLPEEPAMEPEVPVEEEPVEEPMMLPMVQDQGKVSQESARYFGPEYRCAGCVHYLEGAGGVGECDIVAGPIDPEGVCSLFDPDADALGMEEPPAEDLAPAPMPPAGEEV